MPNFRKLCWILTKISSMLNPILNHYLWPFHLLKVPYSIEILHYLRKYSNLDLHLPLLFSSLSPIINLLRVKAKLIIFYWRFIGIIHIKHYIYVPHCRLNWTNIKTITSPSGGPRKKSGTLQGDAFVFRLRETNEKHQY